MTIQGSFDKKFGTKDEVWDGVAMMTKGGLKKDKLMINPRGFVVSKMKSRISRLHFKGSELQAINRQRALEKLGAKEFAEKEKKGERSFVPD